MTVQAIIAEWRKGCNNDMRRPWGSWHPCWPCLRGMWGAAVRAAFRGEWREQPVPDKPFPATVPARPQFMGTGEAMRAGLILHDGEHYKIERVSGLDLCKQVYDEPCRGFSDYPHVPERK